MADGTNDPVIKNYREQISDNDVKILEALNKRIKLVKSLKDYKDAQKKKTAVLKRQLNSMLKDDSVIKYRELLKKLGYNYLESLGE